VEKSSKVLFVKLQYSQMDTNFNLNNRRMPSIHPCEEISNWLKRRMYSIGRGCLISSSLVKLITILHAASTQSYNITTAFIPAIKYSNKT
jgi:hypothetical protein